MPKTLKRVGNHLIFCKMSDKAKTQTANGNPHVPALQSKVSEMLAKLVPENVGKPQKTPNGAVKLFVQMMDNDTIKVLNGISDSGLKINCYRSGTGITILVNCNL